MNFIAINLDKIEHSRRVNPLMPQYISTLAKAGETADAIVSALKKGEKGSPAEALISFLPNRLLTF